MTISNKLIKLQTEQEKAILNAQLEMHEQTLNQISKEIHDNISLSLTLAKLNLNTLDLSDFDYCNKKIENTVELIGRSISELNDISKSLNSDIIINHGILKALDLEISRIENTGLFKIKYLIEGTPIFEDAKKELIIFRIIQESFNNIIKHSKAKNVTLSLNYKTDMLHVQVSDDGIGFDRQKITDKTKAGLNNIASRIKILKGQFVLNSIPNKGTEINFSIPIDKI